MIANVLVLKVNDESFCFGGKPETDLASEVASGDYMGT